MATIATSRTKILSITIAIALLIGVIALLTIDISPAFASEISRGISQDDPPPSTPDGAGDGSDSGADSPSLGQSIMQSITKIFNIVRLDRTSLIDAYDGVLESTAKKAMDKLMPDLEESVSGALGLVFQYNSDGLDGIGDGAYTSATKSMWKVSLSLAAMFFPLLIVANIAEVYVSGVSAPVARSEMLQSVIFSLGRMALAAGSYWIADYGLRIGWSLTGILMGTPTGGSIITGPGAIGTIAAFIIGAVVTVFIPPIGLMVFYIGLFGIFLLLLLISALILSHYAFITIAMLLFVISPLVFVIGGLPYFRWLHGMWLKIATGIIFLPVANAILYKMAELMLGRWETGAHIRLFVGLGFLGLLITVNGMIGKFVFAPVLQAGKMAKNATMGLGKVLASVAAASATGGVSMAGIVATGKNMLGSLSAGQSTVGSLGGPVPSASSDEDGTGPAHSATTSRGSSGGSSGGNNNRSLTAANGAFQRAAANVTDGRVSPQEMAGARAQVKASNNVLSALTSRDPVAKAAVQANMGQLSGQLDQLNAMMPKQSEQLLGGNGQGRSNFQLQANDVLGHFAHNTSQPGVAPHRDTINQTTRGVVDALNQAQFTPNYLKSGMPTTDGFTEASMGAAFVARGVSPEQRGQWEAAGAQLMPVDTANQILSDIAERGSGPLQKIAQEALTMDNGRGAINMIQRAITRASSTK